MKPITKVKNGGRDPPDIGTLASVFHFIRKEKSSHEECIRHRRYFKSDVK